MCMYRHIYEHARRLCSPFQLQPSHSYGDKIFPTTKEKISVQMQYLIDVIKGDTRVPNLKAEPSAQPKHEYKS